MNKLAILLKTAEKVGARNSKGGQDTELAHISPKESALLKLLGGSGRTDPDTGLRHFDDDGGDGGDGGWGGGDDSGWGGDDGWGGDQTNSENSFDDGSMASSMGQNADGSWGDSNGADSFSGGFDNADPNNGGSAWGTGPAVDAGYTMSDIENLTNALGQAAGQGLSAGLENALGEVGVNNSAYSTIDDDGRGKGRSDLALGPGGELEGFGQWSQGVGQSISDALNGWSAEKSNQWAADLLGYDPSKTSLGDVVNSTKDALGLNYVGAGVPGQAMNSVAGGRSTATEDGLPNEDAMAGGMSAAGTHSAFSTGTAAQAGNAVATNGAGPGGRGDTFENVTNAYQDNPFSWSAENNQGGGFGGYANQGLQEAKGWINEHPNLTNAINMGLMAVNPMLGLASNIATSAARGSYGPAVNQLAGMVFGPTGAQISNALTSLLEGTPGNIAAPLASGYLNTVAPNLGTALNLSGLTNLGARGMNTAYQTALADIENSPVDGDLSSEGVGASGEPSFMSADLGEVAPTGGGEAPAEAFAAGASPSWGGGGSSDFSDYSANDFMGSKKKSRYRRPNSLMALLGEQDAV